MKLLTERSTGGMQIAGVLAAALACGGGVAWLVLAVPKDPAWWQIVIGVMLLAVAALGLTVGVGGLVWLFGDKRGEPWTRVCDETSPEK